MMLLHDLLDRGAARYATRCALRCRDRALTYAELKALTVQTAAGLQRLGVSRGDRVAVQLPNGIELVELIFACSRIGAICVPVNPTLKPRQLHHVLQDSGASLLICDGNLPAHQALADEDWPQLRGVVVVEGSAELSAMLQGFDVCTLNELRIRDGFDSVRLIDQDVAALFYTSGSSGRAKGVVVSHRNLVSGAECVSTYLENNAEDRILVALPLSFDYGFSQVSTAFCVGACAVLTNYLSSAALVQEIHKDEITGLAGIPYIWSQLVATKWPPAARSLRYLTNSGGVLTQPVIRGLSDLLPRTRIFCMYGLTEAFRSTYLDPVELLARPGSIGKAVPNQEVMVLRPDGSRCEPNEIGELVHRGSFVTLGYWNDADLTAQRFRPLPTSVQKRPDICVWSGDLVRADEDGYLYFVGRADHQIKSSGVRVSPTEVEEVISEVPGVLEVVVVGVADETLGQVIAAAVVGDGRDPEVLHDHIREHCRVHLPAHMVPSILRLVLNLPRTATGKPDRVAAGQQLSPAASRSEQPMSGVATDPRSRSGRRLRLR
jgi:acyl-CoA ligase (AMP-forming) (exosortase A-associated)